MCDILKNRIKDVLKPSEFLKIPSSSVDRISNMKIAAPKARLVMISNGFMPHIAAEDLPKILAIDSKFSFRVSIDGMGDAKRI